MGCRRELLKTIALAGAGAAIGITSSGSCNAAVPSPATPTAVPSLTSADGSGVWACWIGHATVLINFFGTWILTDPVLFSSYGVSILGLTIGPRRIREPAIHLAALPTPDIILLSHAHMDHMDMRSLDALCDRAPNEIDVITASNTSDLIEDRSWRTLNEMDWGDSAQVNGVSVRALRVKHNGWRMPGEACRAAGQYRTGRSYNGYLLEKNGVRIVFGGDTAYTTEFRSVTGGVDLALMPIGAYDPFPETHCTPEEALAMTSMMGARYMLPIHHSTFRQSEEPMNEPLQRLHAAVANTRLNARTQLVAQYAGQSFLLPLG